MKKLLVVLLALTALSVAAFADDVTWTYGMTVKTGVAITPNSAGNPGMAINDADDTVLSRVRFDAEVALGDFAAHVRVGGDNAGVNATGGVFLNAWWTNAYFANKMVQVQFGNLDHSVTDTVNKGWGGVTVEGGQLVLVLTEGLSIGVGIPATAASLQKNLAGTKIGFAYTMPNMVTLKGTWSNAGITTFGSTAAFPGIVDNSSGKNNSDLALGIAILAVPNLTAELEMQALYLGNKDIFIGLDSTGKNVVLGYGTIEIFSDLEYAMNGLTPGLELDVLMFNDKDITNKTQISIKPKVNYTVMTGTDVGLSVQYVSNLIAVPGTLAALTASTAGANTNEIVVDPYVAFTFNAKAALKIDAAYTIADTSSTSDWSMPININFKYSF